MFEFGVVENIEAVPEEYRELYIPGEGENADRFVVSPAAKGIVEAYLGTNKRLVKVSGDKTKASDEAANRRIAVKKFEDVADELGLEGEDKAEALKLFIQDLTDQAKNGKEIKINMEKVQADADKRVTEALEGKDKELTGMRSALSRHLIDDVATRAMHESGVESIELLLPHIKAKSKVVETEGKFEVRVLDADGDFRTDGKGGFMTVKDLITEMKNDKIYAPAFPSEVGKGTGTPPGVGKKTNTISKDEDLNPTQRISKGLKEGQYSGGAGKIAV